MAIFRGSNIVKDGLVFGYDADDRTSRFYKGEPTTNIIKLLRDVGSIATTSYGNSLYKVTALETKIQDKTLNGGEYSKFIGTDTDSNSQVFWTSSSVYDAKNKQITFSVWLKGSGTCHLTIYDDASGYGNSPTITLTSEWIRYSHTKTVGNYTSSWWGGVRGVINTTTVYISVALLEQKSHATQFTSTLRTTTESLIDLKKTTIINLSDVSFDDNGHPIFDGTDDKIAFNWPSSLNIDDSTTPRTWEVIANPFINHTNASLFGHRLSTGCSYYCNGGIVIYNSKFAFNWYDNAAYRWLDSGIIANQNMYYHIVTTFDTDAKPRIYINGELKNTYSTSTNLDYDTGMKLCDIGFNNSGGGNRWFNGKISVIKFYKNKSLSLQEVQQNFNSYKSRFNI